MKTIMLFSALAFVSIAMTHHAVACDFTHTTSASKQNVTVVACSGGKCEGQSQTLQQGNGASEAR
jgi:uncharacterized protein (DUF305 family)